MNDRIILSLLVIGCVIAVFAGLSSFSDSKGEWAVTENGLLQYQLLMPEYQLSKAESLDNSSLFVVRFKSRDTEIAGLLREPQIVHNKEKQGKGFPGIVLLPGATVTKEREQGLATYLCTLGYASITLDQRNLGAIDIQRDLQMFLNGQEPAEHKMVYDALAAARILRAQPDIDPDRIVYVGESNGGRFAITACAIDPKARGVIAISTSGYGTGAAIASGKLNEPDMIRFYKSIDPETYLDKIPPRKLAMFHSLNDPIIPYEYANLTYAQALQPKDLYTVKCSTHGHCTEMDELLEKELERMVK
jgi:dienelactone hydrolase